MSHTYINRGTEFPLTDEEYAFIVKHDLWDGMSEMCHQWDIDNDPGAWDMMMECFLPFFAYLEDK
jgi:hypothetical protein